MQWYFTLYYFTLHKMLLKMATILGKKSIRLAMLLWYYI